MRAAALLLALLASPVWPQTAVIYSRADAVQAHRVASVAGLYDKVLIDTALPPGAPWRDVVAAGICASKRVLLLWSRRAAKSPEVAREIQTARLCGVPVVPVLLDGAPLPGDVTLHGIDWR